MPEGQRSTSYYEEKKGMQLVGETPLSATTEPPSPEVKQENEVKLIVETQF